MNNHDELNPTIFSTFRVPEGHPARSRPASPLPLDHVVEAARIASAFPQDPELGRLVPAIVAMTITPEEFGEVLSLGFLAAWRDKEKSRSTLAAFASIMPRAQTLDTK